MVDGTGLRQWLGRYRGDGARWQVGHPRAQSYLVCLLIIESQVTHFSDSEAAPGGRCSLLVTVECPAPAPLTSLIIKTASSKKGPGRWQTTAQGPTIAERPRAVKLGGV
jgi:hypothetical protein